MALDFFDAGINRIAAWAVGFRSLQKALLNALLIPHAEEKKLQDENRMTELMIMQEKLKTYPLGEVWDEYLRRCNVPCDDDLVKEIRQYEDEVLLRRI